jgi:hypothetical protein
MFSSACAASSSTAFISSPAALTSSIDQGLTLVHLSAQRQRLWWDKGYEGIVQGVLTMGLEGVLSRLVDVLSVRNG